MAGGTAGGSAELSVTVFFVVGTILKLQRYAKNERQSGTSTTWRMPVELVLCS